MDNQEKKRAEIEAKVKAAEDEAERKKLTDKLLTSIKV